MKTNKDFILQPLKCVCFVPDTSPALGKFSIPDYIGQEYLESIHSIPQYI